MCDGKQIYVIKHPDLYQKVGVSNHPEKRFEQLQQGSPYELELIGAVDVVDDTGIGVEQPLHDYLALYHHRGEWFAATQQLEGFEKLSKIRSSVMIRVQRENFDGGEGVFGRPLIEEIGVARKSEPIEYGKPFDRVERRSNAKSTNADS